MNQAKVVLVGDTNVGKSSLFVRFANGYFEERLNSTISLDQCTKQISCNANDGKQEKVKINLWDTAGLERAGNMTGTYYRNSKCIVLMYDVADASSLTSLHFWIEDARSYIKSDVTFFLLGNKIDLSSTEREVYQEMAENFSKIIPKENVFQVSVKSGKGVDEFFSAVASAVIDLASADDQMPANRKVIMDQNDCRKQRSNCC